MSTQQTTDDTSLIEQIARGEDAALSALYDRYARILFGLSLKIVGTPEEAEEVVLDVFAQVWRTAERYDIMRARVDSWLFMIARSRSLDRVRARVRVQRDQEASAELLVLNDAAKASDPERDALVADRRKTVLAAIADLPVPQREAIELVYYEGLTHLEVSERTGDPLGTIKTRVRLGLGKLRESLAPGWGGDWP